MKYAVDIRNKGEFLFDVTSKDSSINVDLSGKTINPPDLLLVSLATCVGVYVRKYLKGANLDIQNFTVKASAEFTDKPPIRFDNIKVSVGIESKLIDVKRKEAILRFIKNCPVHNTLVSNPQIDLMLQ